MVFSGIPFLFYFLPFFLIVYFAVPARFRNTVLLLASLFFYGWGEPRFVPVLILMIVQGFLFGILIEKGWHPKACLITSLVLSLGTLGVCKYGNFFLENFRTLTGLPIALLRITLPIGISFYTFQMISYAVEVYWKKVPAQKNFVNLAMYIAMFPQLVAGPIVRYDEIAEEVAHRKTVPEEVSYGIRRFVIGLAKKVIIANSLGEFCTGFKESASISVVYAWCYGIAYALQIYYDFSGYSDMAIGLGRILGFHFSENFRYPFVSKSATEFWRRWHISLGSWFRDYVYIPLGGNRVSKGRWYLNIMVVWGLTGFWHGASWNFLLWGLFFGVLLILEKRFLLQRLENAKVWNHIYMFLVIVFSFLLFDSLNLREGLGYLACMFGAGDVPFITAETVYFVRKYLILICMALVGATPVVAGAFGWLAEKLLQKKETTWLWHVGETIVLLGLLVLVIGFLVDGSFNPFLYFRF